MNGVYGKQTPYGATVFSNGVYGDAYNLNAMRFLADQEKEQRAFDMQKQLAEMKYKYDYENEMRNRQFVGMQDYANKRFGFDQGEANRYYQYGI